MQVTLGLDEEITIFNRDDEQRATVQNDMVIINLPKGQIFIDFDGKEHDPDIDFKGYDGELKLYRRDI